MSLEATEATVTQESTSQNEVPVSENAATERIESNTAGDQGKAAGPANDVVAGLFGDEAVYSDAELSGEVPFKDDDAGKQTKAPPPATAQDGGESASDKGEAKADEQDEKIADGKPPKGFVPTAALHEERSKRQTLQAENIRLANEYNAELNRLNSVIEQLKTARPAEGANTDALAERFKDFKILSSEEFRELQNEDHLAAQEYLNDKQDFLEWQKSVDERKREEGRQKANRERSNEEAQRIVSQRLDEMEEAVPGIFDEDNPINGELTSHAVSNGMDPVYLEILTKPGTKILAPGSTRPLLMGRGAVALLKLLHNTYLKAQQNPTRESQIKEQAAQEVISKITKDSQAFRDLGGVPPASAEATPGKILSEREIATMSEADQERYLRGG